MSYTFGLPSSPVYALDTRKIGDGGVLEERWRYAVGSSGSFCVVLAIQQKNFTGDFPQFAIQLFAAKSQRDQHTLRNEVIKPTPPGAIGAVDQESTFTSALDDGTLLTNHFYERRYLTRGRSLIQLVVAGPEGQAATCRYTDILSTFALTGQEFTGATAEPSPSPALSSAPSLSPAPTVSPSTAQAR